MEGLAASLRGEAYAKLEEVDQHFDRLKRRTVSCGGLIVPLGVAASRAVVCVLAVALLWCTSLAVSRSLADRFVSAPPFDAVVDECTRAYEEVHRQRESHLKCTQRQTKACDVSLSAGLESEKQRSSTAAATNRELTAATIGRQKQCALRQMQALDGVQKLQAAGIALAWQKRSASCPKQDLQRAQALVGDISAARSHAMDVAKRHVQNAQLLQRLSLDALDDVQVYDSDYLRRKGDTLRALPGRLDAVAYAQAMDVKGSMARLNASMLLCAGPDDGFGHQCDLPLQPQLEQMRSQYDVLLLAMRQQQEDFVSFHDNMAKMVEHVKGPINTVSRLVHQINPDFKLPAINVPEVHLPEVHLPPLPSMDDMKGELSRWSQQRQAAAQGYLTHAVGSTDRLRGELHSAAGDVDGLLDDYSPPRFNTSAARAQMEGEAARFLDDEAASLSAFAALSAADRMGSDGLVNASFSWNGSDYGGGRVEALIVQSGLRFEPLSSASLNVHLLTSAFAHLALVATLFDFLWRAWRSTRLVLLYWSRASVGLPTLDLREDATSDSLTLKTCAELGKDPARCLSACFMSPLSGVMIIGVALFLLFNVATALYVPTYLHYVDGCIAPPRNGTFLSRNLFSVSYNYAASDGNRQLLHALDRSHLKRAANCSVEVRDTADEQRRLQHQVDAAQRAYRAALAEVSLLRSCLDAKQLDGFAEAVGLQPYVPLRAVLAPDACEGVEPLLRGERDVSLEEGIFNCSAVPPCESACDGPSRVITATFCQRCGCHVEWFVHGLVLHVLLALLVFASINAARMVLVDALCRIFWKQLFAGSFEFLANCDDFGMTNVTRERILEALRAAVRGHVASGWLLLGGALALNVPWLLVLTFVRSHLDVGHVVEPGALSVSR